MYLFEVKALNRKQEKEKMLSVVSYPNLGLCIEFGDEKIDDDGIYGFAPTQDFIEALKSEIEFHVENTIGNLSEHPTLRRVHACMHGEGNEETKV